MYEFFLWFKAVLTTMLLPALIQVVIGLLAIRVLDKLVCRILEKSHLEKAAHSLIRSVVKTVCYVILALIVAPRLGIEVTSLVALASVLTLAISLSIQNLLTNVFGGFVLLYTRPFTSGDFVEIAGQTGSVQEIGLTYTKLLTGDNKVIAIPNSAVSSAQVVNYTAQGTRRVDFLVTASYDAPLETVFAALKEAAEMPQVLPEPACFVAVNQYGESAIEYLMRVWVKSEDYWDVYFTVNKNIKAAFDKANVEMTYPHLNVHLDK